MSQLRSVPDTSLWLPELANPGIAYVLLGLGLAGALAELVSTVFVPRLVLYALVLAFGAVGLVQCRRRTILRSDHGGAVMSSIRPVDGGST